jgi:hypothetical protein
MIAGGGALTRLPPAIMSDPFRVFPFAFYLFPFALSVEHRHFAVNDAG